MTSSKSSRLELLSFLAPSPNYLPPIALRVHSIGHAQETSDIRSINQRRDVVALCETLASLIALFEAVCHDILEFGIDFLSGPLSEGSILLHLESGYGDSTSVGGFSRSVV